MLTVLQESHLWDILETCYDSPHLGTWEIGFIRDNRDRYAADWKAYFISPKMNTIFNRIGDHVARQGQLSPEQVAQFSGSQTGGV